MSNALRTTFHILLTPSPNPLLILLQPQNPLFILREYNSERMDFLNTTVNNQKIELNL